MTLPTPMVANLRRLLPMLGSTNDCDVIAARDAIVRELAPCGCDLRDLAAALSQDPECLALVDYDEAYPSIVLMARKCCELDRGRLTRRERKFVVRLTGSPPLRRKQIRWLKDIHRLLKAGPAA